jgi:hypothetical protein
MAFEEVELRGASIATKADIGKGRRSVTVGLDAPLTSEAAAALGMPREVIHERRRSAVGPVFQHICIHLSASAVPFTWNSTEL